MNCRICQNPSGDRPEVYQVKEMMYGSGDTFQYFKCNGCGCLQISNVPENLGSYYESNYYSFAIRKKSFLKRALKTLRLKLSLNIKFLNSNNMKLLGGVPPYIDWIKTAKANYSSKILDVGSGAGELLTNLVDIGFNDLTGVDPFIEKDVELSTGCRLVKQELTNHDGKYDFIMFNHSLEHVENQIEYLCKAQSLLKENGTIMVRVPLVDSYAWQTYGVDWVQLDPPRHLYLHTKESIKLMARKASLELFETIYDSTDFQFWASELYKQNKPLVGSDNQCLKSPKGLFPKEKIKQFKQKATELNNQQKGDQAAFFLRKPKVKI